METFQVNLLLGLKNLQSQSSTFLLNFTKYSIDRHLLLLQYVGFALEERFEKIGKEMVHKCGYLPLAISLLGGVLRKKISMEEWELVNKDIKEVIYRDEKQIDGVLNLSYESLPYYLKPCFLYMGILFNEDETIDAGHLYKMWIAQGMISHENIGDKEDTLMDIAELYLSELASRSLVQVEIMFTYDVSNRTRKYETCKLHDVVRELFEIGEKGGFWCAEFGISRWKT